MLDRGEGGGDTPRPLDLLYVVRPGDDNEELRYSLRSVARNLPHRKVWIAGHCPGWVRNVEAVELPPHPEKFPNQRQSLQAALWHLDLAGEFVLMNDDMFVVSKIEDDLPCWHLGPAQEHIDGLIANGKRENDWTRAVRATAQWAGSTNAYEAHIPLLFNATALRLVLSIYPPDQLFAAGEVYALTRAGSAGHLGSCVKVTNGPLAEKLGTPFLSTVDWSFRDLEVGRYIRGLFPEKCEYEA